MYASSAGALWALVGAATLFLLLLPALPRPAAAVAVVHPNGCNGCRRCLDDCPYAAITMVPHPEGEGRQFAQVNADLCASCGICAGSCPSSTPFRGGPDLVTGIDMPQLPVARLRRSLDRKLDALTGSQKIVVFGCDAGVRVEALAGAEVASLSLICIGMLPPSFVEYALRRGAAGVLVSGCRAGGCAYRLGNRWTEERLVGAREPHSRAGVRNVRRGRLRIVWADRGEEGALRKALAAFRSSLASASAPATAAPPKRMVPRV
jgi:coenzyme F420-reducing hydrogenase delta subunit/ferredoxin